MIYGLMARIAVSSINLAEMQTEERNQKKRAKWHFKDAFLSLAFYMQVCFKSQIWTKKPTEILCRSISSRELGTFGMQTVSGDESYLFMFSILYVPICMHVKIDSMIFFSVKYYLQMLYI